MGVCGCEVGSETIRMTCRLVTSRWRSSAVCWYGLDFGCIFHTFSHFSGVFNIGCCVTLTANVFKSRKKYCASISQFKKQITDYWDDVHACRIINKWLFVHLQRNSVMHQRRDFYVNSFGTLVVFSVLYVMYCMYCMYCSVMYVLYLVTQIENETWESWASSDVRAPVLDPELLLAAPGLLSSNRFEVCVPADSVSRRWEDQPGSGRICSLRSFWLCYDWEAILEIGLLCYIETVRTCVQTFEVYFSYFEYPVVHLPVGSDGPVRFCASGRWRKLAQIFPVRIILIITYMDSERAGKWICKITQ